MPIGETFGSIIEDVRLETGQSRANSLNDDALETLKARINSTYRFYHRSYDWPHLLIDVDVTVTQGVRYYPLPTTMAFEDISEVYYQESPTEEWDKIEYGITPEFYRRYDSENGEQGTEVLRWDSYLSDQFEVWPLPDNSTGKVRFRGIRRPATLVNDSDIVDLDSDLITFFTAANILAINRQPNAQLMLDRATATLARLRARNSKTGTFKVGNSLHERGYYDRYHEIIVRE